MADRDLLEKVKGYVITLLSSGGRPELYFHNLEHTQALVKAVREIAQHSKLAKNELTLLESAAWFYDAGYMANSVEYQQNSAKMARTFLEQQNTTEEIIKRITGLIMATRRVRIQPTYWRRYCVTQISIIYQSTLFYLKMNCSEGSRNFWGKRKLALKSG